MDVDDNAPEELTRPTLATQSVSSTPVQRPPTATQTPPPQDTPQPRHARVPQSGDNPPEAMPTDPDAPGDDSDKFSFVHLYRAWRNERMSPEILPYQRELIQDQLEVCLYQQRNLDEIPLFDPDKAEEEETHGEPFVTANANEYFMQIDLARVQWLLRSYLRLRVRKMESYAHYYFEHPEFLSTQEKKLVKDLAEIEKQQYEQMCIKSVDARVRKTLMTSEMMPKPDFGNYVFCEVLEDNTTIIYTNTQPTPSGTKQQKRRSSVSMTQESVVHSKGDRFFTLYAHVRPLLVEAQPRICLI